MCEIHPDLCQLIYWEVKGHVWSEQEVETIQEEVYYHFVQLFHLHVIKFPFVEYKKTFAMKRGQRS